MISVADALALVLRHAATIEPAAVRVSQALGLVLAEEVASDGDSPAWDKAMVDGYAVRAGDLSEGRGQFVVLEEVVAGSVPTKTVLPGTATRVMTGAPVPPGCDAVVMVERTMLVDNGTACGRVEIDDRVKPGQNILRRGSVLRRGQIVLQPGKLLRAMEIGLLSELGRTAVTVIPRPRVAILSTGNEIVCPDRVPGPGQIRNSNGPMLAAAVLAQGAEAVELGIARDEIGPLRERIAEGLESDILVLSGGVSAGVLDLVPRVLAELQVEQVFHKVRLKPGKPLWFGVSRGRPRGCLVFGLPGNPVSSLVCFALFVQPAIGSLAGKAATGITPTAGRLAHEFAHRGDRPTYHPAICRQGNDGAEIELLRWQGSADLFGLSRANALAIFPEGDRSYEAGERIAYLVL
jgi:molybdopterin molybdotransferase